jgi:glyoxylase-like metal-dependent hydrolase (beta-lactamase superfamily II)
MAFASDEDAMLIKQITVGSMAVCCYILVCEETRKGCIIDPGGDEKKVLAYCKDENINVKYIICTHGHPDHVCGNKVIQDATGAKIIMHQADIDFFARPDIEKYFSILGLPPSPPADMAVQDGEIITVGTIKLNVIHTPGHTPGGICLYSAPHLFTGDTLFVGGVGRTDFPGGSTNELLDSIKRSILSLPGDTVVWPGHGYGGASSTVFEEERSNPYLTGGW